MAELPRRLDPSDPLDKEILDEIRQDLLGNLTEDEQVSFLVSEIDPVVFLENLVFLQQIAFDYFNIE